MYIPKKYSSDECPFHWLDLEADEENPLPCPFCGERVFFSEEDYVYRCFKCSYRSGEPRMNESFIEAHNRVAKAVKESEKEND